jgi:hypothetical protein
VTASVTLDMDVDSVPEGSAARAAFEAAFKADVAAALTAATQVRKAPRRPRARANFSPLSRCSHRGMHGPTCASFGPA